MKEAEYACQADNSHFLGQLSAVRPVFLLQLFEEADCFFVTFSVEKLL